MFKDSIMYSSEGIHGDQIELVRGNDGFYAEAWNDGYPNRMGGGGYGRRIPDSLIIRFSVFKFDQWLRENFWGSVPITICRVCSEQNVRDFFHQHQD